MLKLDIVKTGSVRKAQIDWLRQNLRILVVVLVLIVAVVGALVLRPSESKSNRPTVASSCGPYRPDGVVTVGTKKIIVEVAETAQEQNKGLSGRPCINDNQGMLFVFNKPGQYSFWMKDMKFPIDIIWISADHKAVVIQEDVLPSTYPDSFENPKEHPAQYVLELKAHQSTVLDINPGTAINF